jgi:hypothetical protein
MDSNLSRVHQVQRRKGRPVKTRMFVSREILIFTKHCAGWLYDLKCTVQDNKERITAPIPSVPEARSQTNYMMIHALLIGTVIQVLAAHNHHREVGPN